MKFEKGDLVTVKTPTEEERFDLCIVTATTVPCVYRLNEFFMVYSIKKREKFVTVKKFMTKVG